MEKVNAAVQEISAAKDRVSSGFKACTTPYAKIKYILGVVFKILFHLRKIVLAAPVLYFAFRLAGYNSQHLPEEVGIILQSTGEYAQYISRGSAVSLPLFLTCGCLGMMFLSRKAMYSWAISVFTLVLPVLLLLSNLYPA